MPRDKEIVHKTMSRIRGKNTGIERKLRKALTEKGIRYRLYSSKVIGHPDILLERENLDFGLFYIKSSDNGSIVKSATEADVQDMYEEGVDAFFNIERLGDEV